MSLEIAVLIFLLGVQVGQWFTVRFFLGPPGDPDGER